MNTESGSNRGRSAPARPPSRIAVVGLSHLGCVTSACLAAAGFDVIAYDEDANVIAALAQGSPPVFEPGLEDLVKTCIAGETLKFTSESQDIASADIIWITYDTPLDAEDRADTDFVLDRVMRLYPFLRPQALVVLSSQVPVGSTRRLEEAYRSTQPDGRVTFAYSPENLQLGQAIGAFTKPARIIAGVRNDEDRDRLAPLFGRFTEHVEWMRVESAEMTKHAINAFLAMSIAYINEIGGLCEKVDADATEVERGLKSEARIGPRAYLKAGAAFAGGTLARDIGFLDALGKHHQRPVPLLTAVRISNDAHRAWAQRRLADVFGSLRDRRIAILGLTYKPGTDSLRRSMALELCRWLADEGARVAAYDPTTHSLPQGHREGIELVRSSAEALRGASAAVITTEWPEFRQLDASRVVDWMVSSPIVLDAGAFLEKTLGRDSRIRYLTVGRPEFGVDFENKARA